MNVYRAYDGRTFEIVQNLADSSLIAFNWADSNGQKTEFPLNRLLKTHISAAKFPIHMNKSSGNKKYIKKIIYS